MLPQPMIPEPIIIGLLSMMGVLSAAIFGLIGTLVVAWWKQKADKRSADIQQDAVDVSHITAGVSQQNTDIARLEKLAAENAGLRKEISDIYDLNRKLRSEVEAAALKEAGLLLVAAQHVRAAKEQAEYIASLEKLLDEEKILGRTAAVAQSYTEGALVAKEEILRDKEEIVKKALSNNKKALGNNPPYDNPPSYDNPGAV